MKKQMNKTEELKVGDRFLYREFHSSDSIVDEAILIEISPSGERYKLRYPNKYESWKLKKEIVVIEILEKDVLAFEKCCLNVIIWPEYTWIYSAPVFLPGTLPEEEKMKVIC